MSQKASGSVILAPDLPVVRHSKAMESCFESLHFTVSVGLQVPDTVDEIVGLVDRLRNFYYQMREHLENDDGISMAVAQAHPPIEEGPLLKMLYAWETNSEVGVAEFKKRNTRKEPVSTAEAFGRFSYYQECWKHYRLWMFEANRALRLASSRVCL